MKVAITANRPNNHSSFEPRFGRCSYFIIFETDSMEWEAYENSAAGKSGGAGTHAAQFIAEKGVHAVISGKFGPNAYNALKAANIQMFNAQSGDVTEIITDFRDGKLNTSAGPQSSGRRPR